jgi:hypothetical protein
MKEKQINPPAGYYGQMALDLIIEEEPVTLSGNVPPTPEEARLRSETARQLVEGSSPKWVEDYQELRDAGWPWRVAAYIAWASSPKIGREPKTLADLASVLGLTSTRTIHKWRENNPAINEVIATLQAGPLMEHRRDVLDALAKAASDSDHRNNPDRRLYLEIIGDYVPHAKVDVSRGDAEDLSTMSDDELDVLSRKAMKRSANHGDSEGEEGG